MKVTIGSYKGHPTISLDADAKFPFTFGVAKAQMILAALPEIQRFVASNTPKSVDRFDTTVEDNMARQCGLVR